MRFALILSAGLSLSFHAMAADDPMANYYGNTVIGKSRISQRRLQPLDRTQGRGSLAGHL
jgi:hypothetical protein